MVLNHCYFTFTGGILNNSQSQWPCCLRRRSKAARFPGLRVRTLPGARMSVPFERCVFSGRGSITCPNESYRMCSVSECGFETWTLRRPWPTRGSQAMKKILYYWLAWRWTYWVETCCQIKKTVQCTTQFWMLCCMGVKFGRSRWGRNVG